MFAPRCQLIAGAFLAAVFLPVQAAEIKIEQRYLHVPVAEAGEPEMIHLRDGDQIVRYFSVALPASESERLYWSSTDVGGLRGKTLTMEFAAGTAGPDLAAICEQSDKIRRPPQAYREERRPQFHFSPMVGWTNDPNGLVYFDGEYHLFFQHNPYGTKWGNMTWGHAVSPDLVHWEEIGDALQADRLGTMFSGSGVVDHRNTSGFESGSVPPMVVFYTAAGSHAPKEVPFTQALAYSVDRGRSWTKYEGNPVVEFMAKGNRDPKVFWHEASRQWVMALYLTRGEFILLGSKNLREWRKLSDVPFPDGHECPEFFELPVDGNAADTRWVFWEGGGRHILGRFDGEKFAAESGVLPSEWGANSYAGQTYNDVPDGRRILLTWMRSGSETVYAGMPFNQQMSFPRELSLRTTGGGVRLFQTPAREIEKLYEKRLEKTNLTVAAAADALGELEGELFDVDLQLQPDKAATVTLDVRGTPITYSSASGALSCLGKTVSVELTDGRLDLRVLVDRASIEIFAAEGRYVKSFCFTPEPDSRKLELRAGGGQAKVASLKVRELKSIWK